MTALLVCSALALLAWVGVLIAPQQAHRLREWLDADVEAPTNLSAVTVLIPARDEAEMIGHVIDDQHVLARRHRVPVNLEGVTAVLEVEGLAQCRRRELARLADRAEPGAQAIGKLAGIGELITFDMGGTSTDVALLWNFCRRVLKASSDWEASPPSSITAPCWFRMRGRRTLSSIVADAS